MSVPRTDLYELLPAVYRLRDADRRLALLALLRVIGKQVGVVQADIDRLYENWFVETCDEWVVPYIGDLIGYRPVAEAGSPSRVATAGGRELNRALIPRREIADTIRFRRRKGTVALLENLAYAVAGWPARAVEFYTLLGVAQPLNHLHADRGRTADLRDMDALDRLGGAFDEIARTVEVLRASSPVDPGRFNIPSFGLFVWRLRPYSVTRSLAYLQESVAQRNLYTFSVLGNDAPLFTNPRPAQGSPDEASVPERIRRHALAARDRYVGAGKSFEIWIDGAKRPAAPEDITVADLSGWGYSPKRGCIAVDPVLGRIAFNPSERIEGDVRVTYHYGFSADIGGGEYHRRLRQPRGARVYRVGADENLTTIRSALDEWARDAPREAVIEIRDSDEYTDPIAIALARDQSLQLRAAVGTRPVIRLSDRRAGRADSLVVTGAEGTRFTLDGLLVHGASVSVEGDLSAVTIRHSTLVPGWGIDADCEPKRPNEPSLVLTDTNACVSIEHSIVGSIQVYQRAVTRDPVAIAITDSIVDACGPDLDAVGGPPNLPRAHALLTVARSTVIGRIDVHAIDLADDSLFLGHVCVARRQRGCMRFCYVAPDPRPRTPRRYHCQPDLIEAAVRERLAGADADAAARTLAEERERVEPVFTSRRYGNPAYAQLAQSCAPEIVRGAEDRSELGAFHDLFQPQRAANLRARLHEYSPAGMDAGLIVVT